MEERAKALFIPLTAHLLVPHFVPQCLRAFFHLLPRAPNRTSFLSDKRNVLRLMTSFETCLTRGCPGDRAAPRRSLPTFWRCRPCPHHGRHFFSAGPRATVSRGDAERGCADAPGLVSAEADGRHAGFLLLSTQGLDNVKRRQIVPFISRPRDVMFRSAHRQR